MYAFIYKRLTFNILDYYTRQQKLCTQYKYFIFYFNI